MNPVDLIVKNNTYTNDGRLSLNKLYKSYRLLSQKFGWNLDIVYNFKTASSQSIPSVLLTTPKKGTALWILAGVHGEEPAGPNAIAENIELIGKLGQKIPIVLFPLLNPLGYSLNSRYYNEIRDWKKDLSVSDSENYLIEKTAQQPQAVKPKNPAADALIHKIINLINIYPPKLTIDHHEDEMIPKAYIYSQGERGANDPLAAIILRTIEQSGMPIQLTGLTRFGERLKDGIISPVEDGSIDELLSAEKIIFNKKFIAGPNAKSAIVIETPTLNYPLSKRVKIHSEIIKIYYSLFKHSDL